MNASESSNDEPQTNNQKMLVLPKVAKKENSSDEDDSSEESSDVEPKQSRALAKSSSSEDDTSVEDSEEEELAKTPKKKANDVVMEDASIRKRIATKSERKAPKTVVTPQAQTTGSKTLFEGNLSFSVERPDVEEFFKDAGEVVDVQFSIGEDSRFRGFGNDNSSYQKSGKGEHGKTIYIRGFDKSLGEDEIRSALEEHFGSYGEMTRVSIPKDYETGASKGLAYVDFSGDDGFSQALELNGSDINGYNLTVEEARPRGDNRDGFRPLSVSRCSNGRGSVPLSLLNPRGLVMMLLLPCWQWVGSVTLPMGGRREGLFHTNLGLREGSVVVGRDVATFSTLSKC
ncbi:nucleolin 2-like [Aristolochia californica]|uniref:nucleolin 2-like n=1 Tax=Aristolochia californica TaxID=171875 RepID=UPI0035DCCDDB